MSENETYFPKIIGGERVKVIWNGNSFLAKSLNSPETIKIYIMFFECFFVSGISTYDTSNNATYMSHIAWSTFSIF